MGSTLLRSSVVVLSCFLFAPTLALAAPNTCGQPFSLGADPSTSDALFTLKAAVDLVDCDFCLCDIDDSGEISTLDALIDLKLVVGQPVVPACPACETTTTTLGGGCLANDALDGVVFNEKYNCTYVESGPAICGDLDVSDSIQFEHKGGGNYEVRDVPDTGFVYTGTLACTTFTWMATKPGEYSESGTWEFTNAQSFSGSSHYEADDSSYEGDCHTTGKASPATPPTPSGPAPCP